MSELSQENVTQFFNNLTIDLKTFINQNQNETTNLNLHRQKTFQKLSFQFFEVLKIQKTLENVREELKINSDSTELVSIFTVEFIGLLPKKWFILLLENFLNFKKRQSHRLQHQSLKLIAQVQNEILKVMLKYFQKQTILEDILRESESNKGNSKEAQIHVWTKMFRRLYQSQGGSASLMENFLLPFLAVKGGHNQNPILKDFKIQLYKFCASNLYTTTAAGLFSNLDDSYLIEVLSQEPYNKSLSEKYMYTGNNIPAYQIFKIFKILLYFEKFEKLNAPGLTKHLITFATSEIYKNKDDGLNLNLDSKNFKYLYRFLSNHPYLCPNEGYQKILESLLSTWANKLILSTATIDGWLKLCCCLVEAFHFYKNSSTNLKFIKLFQEGLQNHLNKSNYEFQFLGQVVAEKLVNIIFEGEMEDSKNLLDFGIDFKNLDGRLKFLYLKVDSTKAVELLNDDLLNLKTNEDDDGHGYVNIESSNNSPFLLTNPNTYNNTTNTSFKIFDQSKDKKVNQNSNITSPKHLRQALEILEEVGDEPEQIQLIVESIPSLIKKSNTEAKMLSSDIIDKFIKMSNKFDLDCLKIENVEKNIFKNLCVVNTESLVTLSSYLLKSDVSLVRNLMIFRCISEVAKELGAVEVGLDASELKASNKSTSLIEEVTDDQDKNTDSNSSSENTKRIERLGKILKMSKSLKSRLSSNEQIKLYSNQFTTVGPKIISTLIDIAKFAKKSDLLLAGLLNCLANCLVNLRNQSCLSSFNKRRCLDLSLEYCELDILIANGKDIVLEQGLNLLNAVVEVSVLDRRKGSTSNNCKNTCITADKNQTPGLQLQPILFQNTCNYSDQINDIQIFTSEDFLKIKSKLENILKNEDMSSKNWQQMALKIARLIESRLR